MPVFRTGTNHIDRIQVRISGTRTVGSGSPSEWDGVYLVQSNNQTSARCSWSGDLSADDGWQQLDVESPPRRTQDFMSACACRREPGPCWCGVFSHLSSITVLEWSLGETREIEGVIWPQRIDIRLLTGPAVPHALLLSGETAIDQIESVVAEDDPPPPVCGPAAAGACRPDMPPDTKLLCCIPDPTVSCSCNICGCGKRQVSPIKAPAPNIGVCTGCYFWKCRPPKKGPFVFPTLGPPLTVAGGGGGCGCSGGRCSCSTATVQRVRP